MLINPLTVVPQTLPPQPRVMASPVGVQTPPEAYAAVAATATPVRTFTAQAASAPGKSDQTSDRRSQSDTSTPDREANVVNARTQAPGRRGATLDLSV